MLRARPQFKMKINFRRFVPPLFLSVQNLDPHYRISLLRIMIVQVHFKMQLPSEYWTNLLFKWSKHVWLSNGVVLNGGLKTGQEISVS